MGYVTIQLLISNSPQQLWSLGILGSMKRKDDIKATVLYRGHPIRDQKYETRRNTRKDDLELTLLHRDHPICDQKYETKTITREDDLKKIGLEIFIICSHAA